MSVRTMMLLVATVVTVAVVAVARASEPAARGDWNGDGVVDIRDVADLAAFVRDHYGEVVGQPPVTPLPTATPVAPPTPTATATVGTVEHVWLSPDELAALPTTGPGWDQVMDEATSAAPRPAPGDQNWQGDTWALAAAYACARLGQPCGAVSAYLADVAAAGWGSARSLAVGRNLPALVVAGEVAAVREPWWLGWLADTYTREWSDGRTLAECQRRRPNNWGTHCGAARVAVAAHLYAATGDAGWLYELEDALNVWRGWTGDRAAYSGFRFGKLCWQADPSNPVPVNPAGATLEVDGVPRDVDGVLPDDQRRGGCPGDWPPEGENYVWEALQGAVVAAEMLDHVREWLLGAYSAAPDPMWSWSDGAICRAVRWQYRVAGYPARGDDTWQVWVVNGGCGTDYLPRDGRDSGRPGKNMGWTLWTHGGGGP